ncbi:oligosaccharide flippase family protein [Oceanobacillus oncorhynchi]|uniref:oligosaccharide flippase family protein n=1 Tax=Oceanobacillus oncorhynchi TaxID=545501 RepID=UPI0034D78B7E
MKINQRKAGVILSYLFTVVNAVVGFLYIPLIIYFIGQDQYGLYQLFGSILIYLGLFDFGLGKTVTRYYSKYMALGDEKSKENLLGISSVIFLVLSLFLLIIGTIIYPYLESFFGKSLTVEEILMAEKMYLVVLFTAIITVLTSVFKAVITAYERFIFLKGIMLVQVLLRPIVVLAVFLIESNAFILIVIQAFLNIGMIIAMIYYSFKKLKIKIKLHYWDSSLLKELVRFSFFIFITAVVDQIFWRADQIILGSFVGTTSVAIYSIGSQLLMYYMTLSTAMSGVFLPNITKRVTQNASDKDLTDIFIKIGRLQYLLLGAVLIGFIVFGKDFISLWVGEDFKNSYYITLLILLPFTIDLIQNIGLAILQAKNMYGFRAITFLIMAIANIIISIPLAILYGGIGTAIATGVCFLIGNGVVMNLYYYKKVGIDVISFWKEIAKLSLPMLLSLAIGMMINYINYINIDILAFFINISLFSVIYFIIIWFVSLNSYEKNIIKSPLNKIIKLKKEKKNSD